MQLNVVGEGEEASQPSSEKVGARESKGKQRELQRSETCLPILFVSDKQLTACFFFPCPAQSFYPSYGGVASILDPEAQDFLNSSFKEPPVENEEDWLDDQDAAVLTQGPSSKMAEAIVMDARITFDLVYFLFHARDREIVHVICTM